MQRIKKATTRKHLETGCHSWLDRFCKTYEICKEQMVRMLRTKMIQAARMGKMSILVMKTPVTSKCPFG